MRSIKAKLMVVLGLLVLIICIGLGAISFINSTRALEGNLSKTLPKIAEQSASSIKEKVEKQLSSLESIAARPDINDPNISWETKKQILILESKRVGAIKMGIVDLKGYAQNTDGKNANIVDRVFFQKALSGESNVSNPLISKTSNSMVVVYAVPIKNNNEVVGVLIETDGGNNLSDLVNKFKIGTTGTAFMIKSDGTNIASPNKSLVTKMYNPIIAAKKDKKLQALAEIETKMGKGETGIGQYYYGGIEKYVGYAPVNINGWSVGIIVPKNEILSELNSLKVSVIEFSVLFILLGLVIVYVISSRISRGIKSTSKHLDLLAGGNLSKEVSDKYLQSKDEVGEMTRSMKKMQQALKEMISKIKTNSSNINIQSENLSSVSEEIANASQNVTEAINEIAKGTSSQAEDLVNVTDILNEFSDKLSGIVHEIQVVDSNSREISLMAKDSSSEMNVLSNSVVKIGDSFKSFGGKITGLGEDINKINEITEMINSVSEQTNLLALNAAIEAARAGEAGKGFAVVADEIRKLAEQSQNSAEEISKLISGISQNTNVIVQDSNQMDSELKNQVNIINGSIASFEKIIEAVNAVIPKIETVKKSAETIEDDKNTILNRVSDVSSVSIEVSASSEEISASSEEMNASTEEVAASALTLNNSTKEMLEEVNKFII